MLPARMRRVVRQVRAGMPYLGLSKGIMVGLPVLSVLSGLSEALVLVLIARTGIAVSRGDSTFSAGVGPVEWSWSTSTALLVTFALTLLTFILQLATARLGARVTSRSQLESRSRLARAFLQATWDLQSRESLGHLQEVMTSYVVGVTNGANVLVTLFTASLNLLALLIVATIVNPPGALTIFALTAILAICLRPFGRVVRTRAELVRSHNLVFAASVAEVVDTALENKTFNTGAKVYDRLRHDAEVTAKAYGQLNFLNHAVPALYQALAVTVLVGGLAVVQVYTDGDADLAVLGAVLLILLRSVTYGRQLYSALNAFQASVPFLEEVRREERIYRASSARPGPRLLEHIKTLALDDVSYTYGEGEPALRGVSVEIERGEMIGVVGPSGSGKTTLIQLLTRLRVPQSGVYLVNGIPAEEYQYDGWFDRLAVVPQEAHLLEATVAENIRFYRDLSDEQVEAAARSAHVDEEIRSWTDGYDTPVSGIAGGISGGQAQRLSIARALAGDPDLLVLDEPTSALDMKSESLVQETLAGLRGHVTTVVIAHRLSTVKLCDRIIVVDNGRVVALDSPDKLSESSEFYREALDLSQLR